MKIRLKNYTTDIHASKTIAEIQELLAKSGARAIALNYDSAGHIESLFFKLQTPDGKDFGFKLPAKPDAVYKIMYEGKKIVNYWEESKKREAEEKRKQQALNVAWRIVKEWLEVQFALIQLNQAEAIEIFLPYMVTGENRTLYQDMKENQFKLVSKVAEEGRVE